MKIFAVKLKEIMNTFCNSRFCFKTAIVTSDDNGVTIESIDVSRIANTRIYIHKSAFAEYKNVAKPLMINIQEFRQAICGIDDYTLVNLHIPLADEDELKNYIRINYARKFANVTKIFTYQDALALNNDFSVMYSGFNYVTTKISADSFKFIANEINFAKPKRYTNVQKDNIDVRIRTYNDKVVFYYKDMYITKCNISHPATIENHYISTILNENEQGVNIKYDYITQYIKLLKCATGDVAFTICTDRPITVNYKLFNNTVSVTTIIAIIINRR